MAETLPQKPNKTPLTVFERLTDPRQCTGQEQELVDFLRVRYGEPHRHHHTFDHPLQMVRFLEPYAGQIKKPTTMVWAILYHDVVCNPVADSTEDVMASARMAVRHLSSKLYDSTVRDIDRYIQATADHTTDSDDPELKLFLDADMAILGADPEEYTRYTENIREEYGHIRYMDYVQGRRAFLVRLMHRKRIFLTDTVHAKLELKARNNILCEIDRLDLQG